MMHRQYTLEDIRSESIHVHKLIELVADYLDEFGHDEETREMVREATGMPHDLFDGLLEFRRDAHIRGLLESIKVHEGHAKQLRSMLARYLNKPEVV